MSGFSQLKVKPAAEESSHPILGSSHVTAAVVSRPQAGGVEPAVALFLSKDTQHHRSKKAHQVFRAAFPGACILTDRASSLRRIEMGC